MISKARRKMKPKMITIKRLSGGSLKVPNTVEGVWFNCGYEHRGKAYATGVVSPSQFVTMSQKSFVEICNQMTISQLGKLSNFLGLCKKSEAFRDIIEKIKSLK